MALFGTIAALPELSFAAALTLGISSIIIGTQTGQTFANFVLDPYRDRLSSIMSRIAESGTTAAQGGLTLGSNDASSANPEKSITAISFGIPSEPNSSFNATAWSGSEIIGSFSSEAELQSFVEASG